MGAVARACKHKHKMESDLLDYFGLNLKLLDCMDLPMLH